MATIGSKVRPIWTYPHDNKNVDRLKKRLEDLGYTDVQDGPGRHGLGYRDVWGTPPKDKAIPDEPAEFWRTFGSEFKEFAEIDDPEQKPAN